jgi:hypothetical protein
MSDNTGSNNEIEKSSDVSDFGNETNLHKDADPDILR